METGVKKEEVLKRVGFHTVHLDHAVSMRQHSRVWAKRDFWNLKAQRRGHT